MMRPAKGAEKSIRVRILGRDYGLRVREDNEVATREIAAYVDARMTAFRRAHPDQPELTAAIITALGIAEDLFGTWEEHEDAAQSLEGELVVLSAQLGSAMDERPDAPKPPAS